MLVSPWQLISILVLAVCSLANSNLYKRIEVPPPQIYSLDDGADHPNRGPPPVGRIDGFDHDHDQINGMIAEASAIACSTDQTKQLSGTEGPGDGWNIASRNTPEQSDGHKNGEACRNIGAMSDVQLRPLSDLEEVIQADIIGPEKDLSICENTHKPIPVCAPDQLTDAENFAGQLPRCRPYIAFLGCAPNLLWCCMVIWPNPEVVILTENDMDPFFRYGGGGCVKVTEKISP